MAAKLIKKYVFQEYEDWYFTDQKPAEIGLYANEDDDAYGWVAVFYEEKHADLFLEALDKASDP